MALNPANQYTDFDHMESGRNGTIKGKLPIKGSTRAFRYRKTIILDVDVGGLGDDSRDVVGEWVVRIRENADVDEVGKYNGKILFEQTIKWTARIYVLNLGVSFIYWQALGDGGSGKQRTTICAEQECAVVLDVNDKEEMAAYGETGAWRFLNNSAVRPEATDRAKYDAEKGFSIITEEAAYTFGNYKFFADWQSANYLCDIPEGAVFDVQRDFWPIGSLDKEAAFTFSYLPGNPVLHSLRDSRIGQSWCLYTRNGMVKVTATVDFAGVPTEEEDVTLFPGQAKYGRLHRHGSSIQALLYTDKAILSAPQSDQIRTEKTRLFKASS
jgi:hypothetical protein